MFCYLEQWFPQGDNPSDVRFLSLLNDLQLEQQNRDLILSRTPRAKIRCSDEGQAHCSKAEPCSGATYTNHTQSGTRLVTVDFHNEVLFKFISYPTLGVETKFNE